MMRSPVPPVRENTTLPQLAERFLGSQNNFIPVVDAQTRLLGVVALQDLKEYLGGGQELNAIIAWRGDAARSALSAAGPAINGRAADVAGQRTTECSWWSIRWRRSALPIGSVPRAEALAALSEAIAANTSTTASTEAIAKDTQVLPKSPPAAK